ncbi:MAG TPA: hypothetical protein VEB68_12535 [Croceibacterium sp.]|nr:hypothetical protein [Croceibacterium sp.]
MAGASELGFGRNLTPRKIASTVVAALVLAAAFVLVLQVSIAGAFRSDSPALALDWAPRDATARARLAASLVGPGASPEGRSAARRLALDSVRRDPLMPMALRALGLATAPRGGTESAAATQAMLQAERLSRRDQPVQLWLAEYSLERGDIGEMMRHFDIAMRTSTTSREAVFPLLAAAASNRDFAQALAAAMDKRPPWGLGLTAYMIDEGPDPDLTVRLAQEFLDPKVPEELAMVRSLMARLGQLEEYDLAQAVRSSFGLDQARGSSPTGVREGGFETASGFEPFAWSLTQDDDLWAARESDPAGNGTVLRLSAGDGFSGEVARQLLDLSPGRYRLRARFGDVPDDRDAWPKIEVRCATASESALLALTPSRAGVAAHSAVGAFQVPGACRFQWLSLSVTAPNEEIADPPWVDDLAVIPAGA